MRRIFLVVIYEASVASQNVGVRIHKRWRLHTPKTAFLVLLLGTMTVLEALAILQSATRDCKKRNVNTPEVREALDSLERYIYPKWLIPQFRHHALNDWTDNHVDQEVQQDVLLATFSGIRDAVRELLGVRADALARKFHET